MIICCYNSRDRLTPTIAHLAAQRGLSSIAHEIIIVDNGSHDGTARYATDLMASHALPGKVIREPQSGLAFARLAGLREASYSYICLVDDDNWVCDTWARTVYDLLNSDRDIGGCGGSSEAVFGSSPPPWFSNYQRAYAVGNQFPMRGYLLNGASSLWGAGLCLRYEAIQKSLEKGWKPWLPDRQKRALSSGNDSELCLAIRRAGYQLFYEPKLTFKHFIPSERLTVHYLIRLSYGFGMGVPFTFLQKRALAAPRRHMLRAGLWVSCAYLFGRHGIALAWKAALVRAHGRLRDRVDSEFHLGIVHSLAANWRRLTNSSDYLLPGR